jgi:hypothetical protein
VLGREGTTFLVEKQILPLLTFCYFKVMFLILSKSFTLQRLKFFLNFVDNLQKSTNWHFGTGISRKEKLRKEIF